jgi:hypothetical protein
MKLAVIGFASFPHLLKVQEKMSLVPSVEVAGNSGEYAEDRSRCFDVVAVSGLAV